MGKVTRDPYPWTSRATLKRSVDLGSMCGLCPCGQRTLFFEILNLHEDFVGDRRLVPPAARPSDFPAVLSTMCTACNSDVTARALVGSGEYVLRRSARPPVNQTE
jgi:hypothetical protein